MMLLDNSSDNHLQNSEQQFSCKPIVCAAISLAIFITRWIIAGRPWNVGYDLIYPESGNGFVMLEVAVSFYLVSVAVFITCLNMLIKSKNRYRLIWIAAIIVSVIPAFGIHFSPAKQDVPGIIRNGQQIVNAINKYKKNTNSYPESLQQLVPKYLKSIPPTGLTSKRRYYYAKKGFNNTKRVPWFYGAQRYIGNEPYVLAVPFVPRGTIIYWPSGKYRNIDGISIGKGWGHSSID